MKSVLIFGKDIKIIPGDLRVKGLDGYFDPQSLTIHIEKTLKGDEKSHTLIHEMVHAVFHRVSINQTSLHPDVQEIICDSIATALTENFKISF